MPVQEFECQIARGQIGRYLNGEGLSSEGLRQLGAHVAECAECKIFLDQRKTALQGMLGESAMPPREQARAVVEVNPSEALIAQIRARSFEDEPASVPVVAKPVKPILTKPIIYCGLLGVVLLGMTYVTRNPTGLLGPHASTIVAADPPSAADAKTTAITPAASQPPVTLPSPVAPNTDPKPAPTDSAPPTAAVTGPSAKATDASKPSGAAKPPAAASKVGSARKATVTKTPPSAPKTPPPPKPKAPSKRTTALSSNPPASKPNRHVVSAGDRAWQLQHPRPGTGNIRVYGS